MHTLSEMTRLVAMQTRSYRLLIWIADRARDGTMSFDVVHRNQQFPDAMVEWMERYSLDIPVDARWSGEDALGFARFFSTYLENSFDFIEEPGEVLYSPEAHCYCPLCRWLVAAPHLKTKHVSPSAKRLANQFRRDAMNDLATGQGVAIPADALSQLLDDRTIFEDASVVAYGRDLIEREQGIAHGPAVLALWRGFAWTEAGSPKHGFRLRDTMIIEAQERMIERLMGL